MVEETYDMLRDPAMHQVLKSPSNIQSETRDIRCCEAEYRAEMPADERERRRPLSMCFGAIVMQPRSMRSRR